MFSYSFAVKLTGHIIDPSSGKAVFESEHQDIKVERMEAGVFQISSAGFPNTDSALKALAGMMLKIKITLLKLKIPHQDWMSFNDDQRLATEMVGGFYPNSIMTPISYRPQVYESARHTFWPAAAPAELELKLADLADIALPNSEFNFGTVRTVEALTVLGLALAAPHAKSKLILSMTAVEILSTRGSVGQDMVVALDALRDKIPLVECTPEIRKTLADILEAAKQESISKACKRAVRDHLGGRKGKEFYPLYDLRSKLVHGDPSRLTFDIEGHADIEKHAEHAFNLALDLALKIREAQTAITDSVPSKA